MQLTVGCVEKVPVQPAVAFNGPVHDEVASHAQRAGEGAGGLGTAGAITQETKGQGGRAHRMACVVSISGILSSKISLYILCLTTFGRQQRLVLQPCGTPGKASLCLPAPVHGTQSCQATQRPLPQHMIQNAETRCGAGTSALHSR